MTTQPAGHTIATLKKKVLKRAATLDVKVEVRKYTRGLDISLDAPDGYCFTGSGLHTNVNTTEGSGSSLDCWDACLDDLAMGVMKCIDSWCDTCEAEPRHG